MEKNLQFHHRDKREAKLDFDRARTEGVAEIGYIYSVCNGTFEGFNPGEPLSVP